MSYLLMLGLLAAPGPPDTLRYQVGLYQDWGSREAAGESRLATITRGARLGLWHRFPNAVYGSVADICWRSGRAELARGSIDLDSIRARKLSLGMTAGDRAFSLPIPSGDEALSCRGGAARLASGRADIQALGGRAVEPSAGGCPVSRQNRYLAGILGNVKSARLTLQPFLTQRGDDTTLSGTPTPNRTVLGTSGDFRVSDRVHLDGRLALSAGEPGSLRPKHAVRVGGAFFGPQLTVRTEAKDVAPGFVSPGARSERDGRRHGWPRRDTRPGPSP